MSIATKLADIHARLEADARGADQSELNRLVAEAAAAPGEFTADAARVARLVELAKAVGLDTGDPAAVPRGKQNVWREVELVAEWMALEPFVAPFAAASEAKAAADAAAAAHRAETHRLVRNIEAAREAEYVSLRKAADELIGAWFVAGQAVLWRARIERQARTFGGCPAAQQDDTWKSVPRAGDARGSLQPSELAMPRPGDSPDVLAARRAYGVASVRYRDSEFSDGDGEQKRLKAAKLEATTALQRLLAEAGTLHPPRRPQVFRDQLPACGPTDQVYPPGVDIVDRPHEFRDPPPGGPRNQAGLTVALIPSQR